MVYYYVQAEFSSIEGTFIIEFRAEFSSIEGTINNHELTLGCRVLLVLGFRVLGFWVFGLGFRQTLNPTPEA